MALIITEVSWTVNPVVTGGTTKILLSAVETPDDYIIYCGTFRAGQEIIL